jgi:hypothetical protein
VEYLNLHTSTLDSVAFIGSEPVDQATWLKLQRYCIGQENSGTVVDCKDWKDRKCQQLLRITRAEMLRDCDLWEWIGNDLHLYGYPLEQETKVIKKRGIARTNGQQGGRPPANPPGTNLGSDVGTDIGSKCESVKEGKGREGNENTTTTAREAEALLAACPRPSLDRPALEAAADCLRRHGPAFGFQRILAGVQAVTDAVADWPADERLAYLPTAANFFRDDLWRRHPDEWKSRREPRKRLTAANGKPALTDDERAARLGGRA